MTSISCKEHRTKPTPIFTPLASKISMETLFFSPPFFLSYLDLQRTRRGQSLHWKPLSLCMPDICVSSSPESHHLDTFLGNCLEFYLPAGKVHEQLLSPLDYRCVGDIIPTLLSACVSPEDTAQSCRLCTNSEHPTPKHPSLKRQSR